MAISQNKYIKITSDVDQFSLGERDFSGLVFIPLNKAKPTEGTAAQAVSMLETELKQANPTYYMTVSKFYSYASLAKEFAGVDNLLVFAGKYFGYRAPDGQVASALTVVVWDNTKYGTASNRTKILSDLIEGAYANGVNVDLTNGYNDFGSLTFIDDSGTAEDDAKIAEYVTGLDHQYLFVPSVAFSSTAAANTYMSKMNSSAGTFVYFGADAYGCAFPMAILGSINFNGRDTTQCFMFKQLSGETPTIKNDEDYETMKSINANFYGLAQTNGRSFAFLQRGFNSNGEDAGVYVNEMWLKSAIAADFLELCMNNNKIPANSVGAAMIRGAIMGNVQTAIENGTILAGKTLTNTDQSAITRFAGTSSAVDDVLTYGYWLGVKIEKDTDGEYKAYYYLVYGKGDGIRFCEGQHKLI